MFAFQTSQSDRIEIDQPTLPKALQDLGHLQPGCTVLKILRWPAGLPEAVRDVLGVDEQGLPRVQPVQPKPEEPIFPSGAAARKHAALQR